MADRSTPKSTTPSDPAAARPASLASSTAATTVIARLRYRPRPEAQVAEAAVKVPLSTLWGATREWDSRMRNRNRWIANETLHAEVAELARKRLSEWNVAEGTVVALARSEVVEVLEGEPMADRDRADRRGKPGKGGGIFAALWKWLTTFSWTAFKGQLRRMPWESLLVMAARKYQNHERLLVYRRIAGLGGRKYKFESGNLTALFVETAPGALWNV